MEKPAAPKKLIQLDDPLAAYLATRGSGKDVWDTDEAREYVESLRGSRGAVDESTDDEDEAVPSLFCLTAPKAPT